MAFATFLDLLPGPFWVARDERGTVVGCAGVSVADDGCSAWLRWGMVDATLHCHGIGRQLLETRLHWIANKPAITLMRVATTAQVSPFFERMGFEVIRVTDDYYGSGLARYDLERAR